MTKLNLSKTQKRWIYAGIWFAFLLFLIFLNDIVLMNENYKIKKANANATEIRVDIAENLEELTEYSDVKEHIYLGGYAYINTELDNTDRFVELIFESEKYTYSVNTELVRRWDIHPKNENSTDMLGYQVGFSPVKMENGVYDLYVKVHENDSAEGVKKTDHKFIKDSTGLHEIYTKEVDNSILEQAVTYDGKAFMGRIGEPFIKSSYVNRLFLKGWFIANDGTSFSDKLYLAVENEDGSSKVYETFPYQRMDVVLSFKNEQYIDSGFTAQIPWEQLSDKATFKLIADIDGKYYIFDEFSVVRKENVFVKDEAKETK